MSQKSPFSIILRARDLKIDSGKHFIVYVDRKCADCQFLGLGAERHVKVSTKNKSIIATLRIFETPLISSQDACFSTSAWEKLGLKSGDSLEISLSPPLASFKFITKKSYGQPYAQTALHDIIGDISKGKFSDAQLASFLTLNMHLSDSETLYLTKAMAESGDILKWDTYPIVDKHCIGGVPGNRTTMILVPIVAAFGLTIPKISSRAITSPSGTADTMGVLAEVDLTVSEMKKVVEQEGGCIIHGGSVDLSPADNYIIEIIKQLTLDATPQMVASILSKKLGAGSTHVLIDIPVGEKMKIRSSQEADVLSGLFYKIGKATGLTLNVLLTDGSQPIGRGIGPALEARDVLSVLRCEPDAPQDLRNKALFLASCILETWGGVPKGEGLLIATAILEEGHALKKFEGICKAQGALREPTLGRHTHRIASPIKGIVKKIDNSQIAELAKRAGAPKTPTAGLDLFVKLGDKIEKKDPLLILYAESEGELDYALQYFSDHPHMIKIEP